MKTAGSRSRAHKPTNIVLEREFDGRIYYHSSVIIDKYSLNNCEYRSMLYDGLPIKRVSNRMYINEDDFHAFCRGEHPDGNGGVEAQGGDAK